MRIKDNYIIFALHPLFLSSFVDCFATFCINTYLTHLNFSSFTHFDRAREGRCYHNVTVYGFGMIRSGFDHMFCMCFDYL